MLWRWRSDLADDVGGQEVQPCTDGTKVFGPLEEEDSFVGKNVEQGNKQADGHPRDCTVFTHVLVEDPHHQGREDRTCSDTKGQGDGSCRKARRVKTQITGEYDGKGHGDFSGQQFVLFTHVRYENLLQQIVGYR